MTIAMDNVLASVGGVCVGTREVVDHQRLSGPGYCFSASACPFLSVAASQALFELQQNPNLVNKLEEKSKKLHSLLSKTIGTDSNNNNNSGLIIKGKNIHSESPIIHLRLSDHVVNEQKLKYLNKKMFYILY